MEFKDYLKQLKDLNINNYLTPGFFLDTFDNHS